MIKFNTTLIKFYSNINVGFVKVVITTLSYFLNWNVEKSVDYGGAIGVLLTDLSKAFDCLSHELLTAKLHSHGSDKRSLVLVYNYLSNRKQNVKNNDSYSSRREILFGVPQGFILRPLLFNIFICDIFYFTEDFEIENYADESTPFSAKS